VRKTRHLLRVGALAVAVLVVAAGATACTTTPQPDEIVLHYHGGSWEGNRFEKVVLPGDNAGNWNVFDRRVYLPTNLRTWNVAPEESADQRTPFVAPSADNVPVAVWLQVNMLLNTNHDDGGGDFEGGTLREFWEVIGDRYDADTFKGWRDMMLVTVVPALTKAVTDTVRAYEADPLVYNTEGIYVEVQAQIGQKFLDELTRLSGGEFFCGTAFVPTWRNGDGSCPAPELILTNIDFANPAIQAARDERRVEEEQAAARLVEAEGHTAAQQELQTALADPDYLRYLIAQMELQAAQAQAQACQQSPNCTVIAGGDAAAVVPAR
jgi:hypothetical protein